MNIPIPTIPVISTAALTFTHWLPLQEHEFLAVSRESHSIRLWLDRSCLGHVADVEDISQHVNLLIDRVFADTTVRGVPSDLVEYIRSNLQPCGNEEDPLC